MSGKGRRKPKLSKWTLAKNIKKGDYRIHVLTIPLNMEFNQRGYKNVAVIPHIGMGTGTDIIIFEGHDNKALQLREVTNFDKWGSYGQQIYLDDQRVKKIENSLTRRIHRVRWGNSRKRIYTTLKTEKILDISYATNLPKKHWKPLTKSGIRIKVWNCTTYPFGYTEERWKRKKGIKTILIGVKRYYDNHDKLTKRKVLKNVRKKFR